MKRNQHLHPTLHLAAKVLLPVTRLSLVTTQEVAVLARRFLVKDLMAALAADDSEVDSRKDALSRVTVEAKETTSASAGEADDLTGAKAARRLTESSLMVAAKLVRLVAPAKQAVFAKRTTKERDQMAVPVAIGTRASVLEAARRLVKVAETTSADSTEA